MSENSTNDYLPFHPVIGTNELILKQTPYPGYLWFATDSKKIYYSDGSSFLSMGGNTGIYYGIKEIPENTPSDQVDFDFSLMEIDGNAVITDGNYKIPNENDLILNIPNGVFYRVKNVVNLNGSISIKTIKLTVSGSGGGSSSGGVQYNLTFADEDNNTTKYFTLEDKDNAKLRFSIQMLPSTAVENNGIYKIIYNLGSLGQVEDVNYYDFNEIIEFDLSPYLNKMSTSTATPIIIQAVDIYGEVSNYFYYYVNVVNLSLLSGYTSTGIITSNTDSFIYHCKPQGGSTLTNKKLIVKFYNEYGAYIEGADIEQKVTMANETNNITITLPGPGNYTMNVVYEGQTNSGRKISSNIISYQVVYYSDKPQLIVNVPSKKIEQYSTLTLTYMIAMTTDSVEPVEVQLINGNNIKPQSVKYNNVVEWPIYFDTVGTYTLIIKSESLRLEKIIDNIQVLPYEGEVPSIYAEGLTLSLSPNNRSNTEINKDSWTYTDPMTKIEYECDFRNFTWGEVNGWQRDEEGVSVLHLSAGAQLEISNLYPYELINGYDPMENGQTIELDVKFSGVTDFTQPLIHCLSYAGDKIQVGFQITGQESTLNTNQIHATGAVIEEEDTEEAKKRNTKIQGLTARFIEDERIRLTWVIEPRNNSLIPYPMILTYLNGILSGATQYDKNDSMSENLNDKATIVFDSTYGNIDIYNIRFYRTIPLSETTVLNNYIATLKTPGERANKFLDNKTLLNDENKISIQNIEATPEYKLSVPYIKITGGAKLIKDEATGEYSLNASNVTQQLPDAKKDYRLIKRYEFIDPSGKRPHQVLESSFKEDNCLNGLVMYGQGTSSMEYPVKNLRIKSKMKDSNNKKVKFPLDDINVDLICLKADYMESSGSHNTGTGNLIYNLLSEMNNMKTKGQEYWEGKVDYNIVTAIKGFPILVFFRTEDEEENEGAYEFVGKYNYNLDKATQEPFGFFHDEKGTFGWDPNGYKEVNTPDEDDYKDYPFDLYYKDDEDNYIKDESGVYDATKQYYSIKNKIHCFEILNNASKLANFLSDENDETFEQTFYRQVKKDNKMVPNWFTSYESRYPEFGDHSSTEVDAWYQLCSWINSTATVEAKGTRLESNYVGLDGTIYTEDTAEYRLAKFKKEFSQHLDFKFTCFYYILTHVLLMIDSRAKNMMIATWDDKIWYPIFYDMDTMLGLNNYGYNKYYYDVEDKDPNVYNGQNSVLWNNFKVCFSDEISSFYQDMQEAGLTYKKLLENYNDKQANAVNETVYNKDSEYKYKRPFSEGYWDNSENEDAGYVEAGTRDYLYASQGNRSLHRKWWLKNRINYFNGKHLSNAYKSDKYTLRLYTPQAEGDNYYYVIITQDEFEQHRDLYFIRTENNNNGIIEYTFTPVGDSEYNAEEKYYKKASSKLNESVRVVPANNDFTLTPLYNQYLSVAYGGDNGDTVGPSYAMANIEQKILTPMGTKYNDTETYLYGGSLLKDLGDLSHQYLGQFHFPSGITKLERLTLGNFNNKYYNPNFAALTIGKSAPYLKELNITNCAGLGGASQNVEYCQNLQKVFATGSDITGITLPANGVLNELRLPETITGLVLINQPNLTTEKLTIGTCNYNAETKEKIFQNQERYRLSKIRIEDTPIDSYSLIRKTPDDIFTQFYLKNVDWHIDNEDEVLGDGKLLILEKLLGNTVSVYENLGITDKALALTGDITLKSNLSSSGLLTVEEALKIYERYNIKPSNKTDYFPNVNFTFEGLNIYNINIVDGQGRTIWTKKIQGSAYDEDNNPIPVAITKEFLTTSVNGIFKTPESFSTIDKIYDFNNAWKINGVSYPASANKEDGTYGWPIIESGIIITGDINIIADYNITTRQYNVKFVNPYATKEEYSYTEDYGTKIIDIKNKMPKSIPYRNDSDLADIEKTYSFIGYNTNKDAQEALEFSDEDIVTGNVIYYTIFKAVSVYENIHEDYFIYEEGSYGSNWGEVDSNFYIPYGYIATLNSELDIKGKITVPHTHKGYPVYGISKFSSQSKPNQNITHVFVGRQNIDNAATTNLRVIIDDTFNECNNLQFFDFTPSLRRIGAYAFRRSSLKPNQMNNVYYFGDNIYYIGEYAFNQALSNTTTIFNLVFSNSLTKMDRWAISNIGSANSIVNIQIGTNTDNLSQLDLGLTSGSADSDTLFKLNKTTSNIEIKDLIFYTNKYEKWGILINNVSIEKWLGYDSKSDDGVWELRSNSGIQELNQ